MKLLRDTRDKIIIIESEIKVLEQLKKLCEDNNYMNKKIQDRLDRIPLLKHLLDYNLDMESRLSRMLEVA